MIWQTDRTSWPYRWNFVCFDSVLSARMMKGCAPDHAQVWAAQRKRACENQVKKVTCLLGNGGRKIIWKPVINKEWLFSIDVDCFAEGIQPGKTCSSKWMWNVSLNLVSMSKHEQCIDEKMPTDGIPDNRQIGLRYGMKLGRRDAWRLVECQPDVGIHWSPCWSDGDGLTSRHRLSL